MTFTSVDASLYIISVPCMDKVLLPHPAWGSHLAVSLHEELQFFAYGSKPGLLKLLQSPRRWWSPRTGQIPPSVVI